MTRVFFLLYSPCFWRTRRIQSFSREAQNIKKYFKNLFPFQKMKRHRKNVGQNSSRLIKLFLQHSRSHLVWLWEESGGKMPEHTCVREKPSGPASCSCISTERRHEWSGLTWGRPRALRIKMYLCNKYCITALWRGPAWSTWWVREPHESKPTFIGNVVIPALSECVTWLQAWPAFYCLQFEDIWTHNGRKQRTGPNSH